MPGVNLVVGDDGSNTLMGGSGKDLIYGFDPNGPQGQVSSIAATRVASGLTGALFAGAPPGDTDHLFIVQQTGTIRVLDLNTGQLQATPFLSQSGRQRRRARPARPRLRPGLREQRLFLHLSHGPGRDRRHRSRPLPRLGQSQRRRPRERDADHHHRPAGRPGQPQGRLDRLRSRRRSLRRARRRRRRRRPVRQRPEHRQPARQDAAPRRARRRVSRAIPRATTRSRPTTCSRLPPGQTRSLHSACATRFATASTAPPATSTSPT